MSHRKPLTTEHWDNRWNVICSKNNNDMHPYFRQYFDKEPGEETFNFQFAYGGMSPDALPGIIDKAHRPIRKDFYKVNDRPDKDLFTLTNETRMPLDYLLSPRRRSRSPKTRAPAFPTPGEHLEKVSGW